MFTIFYIDQLQRQFSKQEINAQKSIATTLKLCKYSDILFFKVVILLKNKIKTSQTIK